MMNRDVDGARNEDHFLSFRSFEYGRHNRRFIDYEHNIVDGRSIFMGDSKICVSPAGSRHFVITLVFSSVPEKVGSRIVRRIIGQ
jgi:hypothetical protein